MLLKLSKMLEIEQIRIRMKITIFGACRTMRAMCTTKKEKISLLTLDYGSMIRISTRVYLLLIKELASDFILHLTHLYFIN